MRRWLPTLAVLPLVLAACGSDPGPAPRATGGQDDAGPAQVSAVAAVYPLAWLAGQIAPEAQVELLNQGSQEAHDIEITPPQRAAIETAEVVLYLGDIGYQPQVEMAVEAAQGQVVDVVEAAGQDALLAATADPHAHEEEEAGEDAHADEEAATEDEHADEEAAEVEGAGVDPHVWFDPAIMTDVSEAVAEAFAQADPQGAQTYRDNAAQVREDLAQLEQDLEATLGGQCRLDEAIVSHAAYAYLLQPHGKEQHALTDVGAEGDASAAELGEIVQEIRGEGITHVLAEPVEGRDAAETVAREAGVELLEIVPLGRDHRRPGRHRPARPDPAAGRRLRHRTRLRMSPTTSGAAPTVPLELDHVSFAYDGQPVLRDVSLQVRQGTFVALVGANGSGKSTLVRLCLGLLRPSRGHVRLFGTDTAQFRQWGQVGYVPQRAAANTTLPISVTEVVRTGLAGQLRPGRRTTQRHRDRLEHVLDLMGLSVLRRRRMSELSGGEQQRALIARALVTEPRLLILDEPTTGVDADARAVLRTSLEHLVSVERVAVVYVSHDPDTFAGLATSVVEVAAGRLHHRAETQQLTGSA